jgi:NADH-quinone oxidoreductase subunit G
VELTLRDDRKVVRVLARDNEDVDDGWLCDKGRFAYQSIHSADRITAPLVRDGGYLREWPWERALERAASILERAGERTAAIVGGQTTNEEGFLVQRLLREGLGSHHVDSGQGGTLGPAHARLLARPALGAKVTDIDHADAVLVVGVELVDEAPILDLRVRKAVRRNEVRLVTLTSRPSTLDASADAAMRYAPGCEEAALAALATALGSPRATGARPTRPRRCGRRWRCSEAPERSSFSGGSGSQTANAGARRWRRSSPWSPRSASRGTPSRE